MIGRVSTFSQTLYTLGRSMETQARLADAQAQTASGLKSSSYGGYGSATNAILRYESEIASADADAANATNAQNIIEQSYAALGSISDLAETVLSSLATDDVDESTLASLAEGWLEDLESLLNSQYSGQSLFGGEALDGQAVDLDAWSDADPEAYYNGTSSARAFVSSDGQSVALSVTADDAALVELVSALKGLAAGDVSASDALDAVQSANSAIGVLQTSLSSGATRLERLVEQATARSDSLTTLVSTLKEADLAEVAILATQYETQLQTSYSTLNILMSVKLSDYLS